MKILHVIPSMNPSSGGPSQGIRNMDLQLKQHFDIIREVVCLSNQNESSLESDIFILHSLGRGERFWSFNYKLKSWLEKNVERFDIVMINGLWQYHSYIAAKVIQSIKRKNISNLPKLVVMPHGMLDPWFQKAKSRRWKALRNYIYWEFVEKKIVNNADALFFTCEEELLLARETFRGYKPKSEINVGYGVALPPKYHIGMRKAMLQVIPRLENERFLLFLSRIDPKKGIDILVNAYKLLLENAKYKDVKLPKLLIAGPGFDSKYGIHIKNLIISDPILNENIFCTDMIMGDTKWGAIYECEAFILPSHQENFGIAVVEALACCKPVLITNKINIWREIQKEGGGIIDEDTLEGTYNNLEKWINLSDNKRIEMAQVATKIYEKYFSIEIGVNGFYNGLLKVFNS